MGHEKDRDVEFDTWVSRRLRSSCNVLYEKNEIFSTDSTGHCEDYNLGIGTVPYMIRAVKIWFEGLTGRLRYSSRSCIKLCYEVKNNVSRSFLHLPVCLHPPLPKIKNKPYRTVKLRGLSRAYTEKKSIPFSLSAEINVLSIEVLEKVGMPPRASREVVVLLLKHWRKIVGETWQWTKPKHFGVEETLVEHFKFFVKNQVKNLKLLHDFLELQNFFSTFSEVFHKTDQKREQKNLKFPLPSLGRLRLALSLLAYYAYYHQCDTTQYNAACHLADTGTARCQEDVRDGPPMIQLCLLFPYVRAWFVNLAWVHLLTCGRNKRGAPLTPGDYRDGIGGRRGRGKGPAEHGEPLTRNQPHSKCGCKSVAGRTAWVPEHPPAHPPAPRGTAP
ncbi:hypothetical protein DFH09DRAFT_1095076 [Mycena vulgaris]|nr:hypothetical protein DFH09DRAFT_1095076 [Mycena vulgaris]